MFSLWQSCAGLFKMPQITNSHWNRLICHWLICHSVSLAGRMSPFGFSNVIVWSNIAQSDMITPSCLISSFFVSAAFMKRSCNRMSELWVSVASAWEQGQWYQVASCRASLESALASVGSRSSRKSALDGAIFKTICSLHLFVCPCLFSSLQKLCTDV